MSKSPLFIDSDGREYHEIELRPTAIVVAIATVLILAVAFCLCVAHQNNTENNNVQELNSTERTMPNNAGGLREPELRYVHED